jgi:DNA-binding transcriptional MerR regulator/DNA gyrase inhibitor GyrI
MELLTISQVSKTYDISTRMLRYYEQMGLIESLRKDDYAYRVYDETAVRRLQQIIILRKLRIPMKHIAVILSEPEASEAVEMFKESIGELDDEINALSAIRRILILLVSELQQRVNIQVDIDLLFDSSVLSIVNLLSLQKNHIKEARGMEDLKRASEVLDQVTDKDVRIVYLPPSTVASIRCVGGEPENDANNIMGDFVKNADLFSVSPGTRFYGFNSPDDIDGDHVHGYEMWATIPDDMDVPAPLTKKTFAGGLYAAYTSKPLDFADWQRFSKWLKNSSDFEADAREPLGMGGCLEEHINSYNFYGLKNKKHILTHLDFLMPIKENGNANV